MKSKFWTCYLASVILLSGLAYVVSSDVSDLPLALSESEMDALRATASNQKCITDRRAGCGDSTCDQHPIGAATYGQRFDDCDWYNGWKCSNRGPSDAQEHCRTVIYTDNCSTYDSTVLQTTSDCVSSLM